MSWSQELYNLYDVLRSNPDCNILPISHSTMQAQIEVTIDEQGCFKNATLVEKNNATTIVPVTEASNSRTNGIAPMPFADKLEYTAGDFSDYDDTDKSPIKNAEKYFEAYMTQLKEWNESPFTHPAVSALYTYLSKNELMTDLVNANIIILDPDTKKIKYELNEKTKKYECTVKIGTSPQNKAFVRFAILYNNINMETRTWLDKSLQDKFIEFDKTHMSNIQLCNATGKMEPVLYKHPKKIRNAGDQAKLFSANDTSNFTFRGYHFSTREDVMSISYDFSQKIHNALKWLFTNQEQTYGSLSITTWSSTCQPLPSLTSSPSIDDIMNDDESYNSLPEYKTWLSKYIYGYKQNMEPTEKVMLLGIDAATPGRASISMYDELFASQFFATINTWHSNNAWPRYNAKKKCQVIRSLGLYEIIKTAYGLESNGKISCDEKVLKQNLLRLLPCVISGKAIPNDLITALYNKASNPLSYSIKSHNHESIIETACGVYRAQKKGDITMGYDPNETDRSYLYGCLLAIADKAESDTYTDTDRNNRVTNAKRFWSNFSQRPFQTWQLIEEHLIPYLQKNKYRRIVEMQIQDIMNKFTPADFSNNERLSPMYLIGYHHFTSYMYTTAANKIATENEENDEKEN